MEFNDVAPGRMILSDHAATSNHWLSGAIPPALLDAGQIDIKAANVKAFAEEMVRDHEAVNKQALALLNKLKVKPEDNGTSKSLADAASKKREELSKLSGDAFDMRRERTPRPRRSIGFDDENVTVWKNVKPTRMVEAGREGLDRKAGPGRGARALRPTLRWG